MDDPNYEMAVVYNVAVYTRTYIKWMKKGVYVQFQKNNWIYK